MASETVNVDNFARAETDRMFAALQQQAAASTSCTTIASRRRWTSSPSSGRTGTRSTPARSWTLGWRDPDAAGQRARYLSVMVVNEDHYINRILHEPGTHELTVDEYDTDYVLVAARTLVDPNDPADVAAVNALQDQMRLEAGSARRSLPGLRQGLARRDPRGAAHALPRPAPLRPHLRRREDVDPVRHLIGTAAGGADCPSRRRSTSTSSQASRSAATSCASARCRSTRSGRSRSTTRPGTSSRSATGT